MSDCVSKRVVASLCALWCGWLADGREGGTDGRTADGPTGGRVDGRSASINAYCYLRYLFGAKVLEYVLLVRTT